MPEQKNQGEGNWEAARAYDRDQHKFAQSGKPGEAAREAEKAMQHPDQRRQMDQAEREAKRHSHGEDPALKK